MNTTELLQVLAQAVDTTLKTVAGKKTSFSIIVWQDGEANYVSNSDRESVRKAMQEVLDRWNQPHYKNQ
jgi:hypothetical protein